MPSSPPPNLSSFVLRENRSPDACGEPASSSSLRDTRPFSHKLGATTRTAPRTSRRGWRDPRGGTRGTRACPTACTAPPPLQPPNPPSTQAGPPEHHPARVPRAGPRHAAPAPREAPAPPPPAIPRARPGRWPLGTAATRRPRQQHIALAAAGFRRRPAPVHPPGSDGNRARAGTPCLTRADTRNPSPLQGTHRLYKPYRPRMKIYPYINRSRRLCKPYRPRMKIYPYINRSRRLCKPCRRRFRCGRGCAGPGAGLPTSTAAALLEALTRARSEGLARSLSRQYQ